MSYMHESGDATGLSEAVNDAGRDFLNYDPTGLPDARDVKNINVIIRNHEKAHPGEIALYVQQAKQAKKLANETTGFTGFHNTDKTRHRVLTMPTSLMRTIEEAYPLMFRNRQHLAWFKKTYPGFDTSGRS